MKISNLDVVLAMITKLNLQLFILPLAWFTFIIQRVRYDQDVDLDSIKQAPYPFNLQLVQQVWLISVSPQVSALSSYYSHLSIMRPFIQLVLQFQLLSISLLNWAHFLVVLQVQTYRQMHSRTDYFKVVVHETLLRLLMALFSITF